MADKKVEVEISAKATGFQAEFAKISSGAADAAGKIRKEFSGLGATLAASLSVGAFALFIKSSIDAADKLNDLSKATGVSAGTLGGIGFAAQQAGTDLEGAAKAIGKLNLYIAEAQSGNAKAVDTFNKLGISINDLKRLKTEDILYKAADAFASFEDDANKAAGANEIFGKSYQSIIPLLDEGGNSLRQNVEYFKQYSGVSDDLVRASDQFNDSLTKLTLLNKAFGNYLAAALLPSLQDLSRYLLDAKEKSTGFKDAASGIVEPLKVLAGWAAQTAISFGFLGEAIGARAAQLVAMARFDFGGVKLIQTELEESYKRTQQRIADIKKIISNPGGGDSPLSGAACPAKKPTPGFGGGAGGNGREQVDAFAKAIERVGKLAAEADLELAAMFSTQEITAAQKALAQLTASEEWKKFTQPQKDQLTAKFNAVDAIERETLAWKKKREEIEKEIKALKEHEEAQQRAAEAFTQSLGAYADQNSVIERQIELVGKDDLAHQKFIETLEFEKLKNQALAADRGADITILEQQFQKRIALIEQLSEATQRFQQIQELNSVFTNSFADGLVEIVNGTKSVKDAFKDMERSIVDGIARIAAQNLANSLFGVSSTGGGGIAEWLLKIGGLFAGGGGGGFTGFGAGPFAFANGTNSAPGGMALVGERGPELVNLPRGAQVIPNDVLTARRAERSVVVNNTFMVSGQTDTRSQRQIAGAASNAVLSAMRDR